MGYMQYFPLPVNTPRRALERNPAHIWLTSSMAPYHAPGASSGAADAAGKPGRAIYHDSTGKLPRRSLFAGCGFRPFDHGGAARTLCLRGWILNALAQLRLRFVSQKTGRPYTNGMERSCLYICLGLLEHRIRIQRKLNLSSNPLVCIESTQSLDTVYNFGNQNLDSGVAISRDPLRLHPPCSSLPYQHGPPPSLACSSETITEYLRGKQPSCVSDSVHRFDWA